MRHGLSAMKVFLFFRLQNVFILLQCPFSAMHVFALQLRSAGDQKICFCSFLEVGIQRCLAHHIKLHRICPHCTGCCIKGVFWMFIAKTYFVKISKCIFPNCKMYLGSGNLTVLGTSHKTALHRLFIFMNGAVCTHATFVESMEPKKQLEESQEKDTPGICDLKCFWD